MNVNIKNFNLSVIMPNGDAKAEEKANKSNKPKDIPDGVYLIYNDRHYEPFSGNNSKKEVKYIGLKHKDVVFAISLKDNENVQLLDDDSKGEQKEKVYYSRECDALFDFDGRKNTERLVSRNPKLKSLLDNDEYIPSLGQLNLMAHYMEELNKAFTYVSGSLLSSAWYWSSTEHSQYNAWVVIFSSGNTYSTNKCNSYRVRAVAAFTFTL